MNTTGGFKDTAGRRMISHIGAEDCCGNLYQWGVEMGSNGSSWADGFDVNDAQVGGQFTGANRSLFGGSASDSFHCVSRCCDSRNSALILSLICGCRAVSEPLLPNRGISF